MANADSNEAIMELDHGQVHLKFYPDVAPVTVARIKELIRSGFYDNVVFHRVIEGFMAQTGDPTGTGMGGSGKKLKAEFSNLKHRRGIVSMARAMDPDSADSQFFIVYDDAPHLDGQYTIFGEVTQGMEYIDMLEKGMPTNNGMVGRPDKIIKMFMVE